MKTLRIFASFAVFLTVCAMVFASETSDNFAKWAPDFADTTLDDNGIYAKRRDAQQNWQTFCKEKGNDPSVQKEIIRVSIEQLAKDNPVDAVIWIVRQLGIVGDASAVPALAKCLTNADLHVREEAARALANIPGKEAEDALKAVNVIAAAQLAKDALTSRTIKADIPVPAAETQFPQTIPYIPFADNAELSTWMEKYDSLTEMEKAQVLSNLTTRSTRMRINRQQRMFTGIGGRGQGAGRGGNRPAGGGARGMGGRQSSPYLPLALEAVKSSHEGLRDAGIIAVGALGGVDEVPFLLEQALSGGNQELARVTLSRMSGQRIDDALMGLARGETDSGKLATLAIVLNNRFNTSLRTELLNEAVAADTQNRLELLQAAEPMATKEDIPKFVQAWLLITDRRQKDRTEQIIARLSGLNGQVGGDSSLALEAMGDKWDTPEGLSLLGRIGDPRSLEKIGQSKNAVQAYRNWPNAGPNTAVANNLLAFVKGGEGSQGDKTTALRAYIRVISLATPQGQGGNRRRGGRIGAGMTDVQKVGALADAFELATRNEEKVYIIQRVGTIRTLDSLRFVMKYIDVPEFREDACQSVLELAHQTFLRRQALEEFGKALDKVLEVTNDPAKRNRATDYKSTN